jgi:hypothetical protein
VRDAVDIAAPYGSLIGDAYTERFCDLMGRLGISIEPQPSEAIGVPSVKPCCAAQGSICRRFPPPSVTAKIRTEAILRRGFYRAW